MLRPFAFAVSIKLYIAADEDAPFGVSANSQFLRPTVNGRIAFSAILFDMAHLPSRR